MAQPQTETELGHWIPAKAKDKKSKATEVINNAFHEAMRYKPVAIQNRFAAIEPPPEASTQTRSALKKTTSQQVAAKQVRTRFANMEFDEVGEPLGQPCRSSCGCMGACDENGSLKWDVMAMLNEKLRCIRVTSLHYSSQVKP